MFQNRLNICKIAGIKIGIDLSWIFIAILLSWTLAVGNFPYYYPNLTTGTYWLMGVLGMLGLFICILLHEFGHALVAKHYQLPIEQITLFIFGGVAEIKKEPPSPKVEFLVSIAGPIVSVLLAALMYVLTLCGKQLGWPVPVLAVTGYLALINVIIVVFNLIPAFPLDGGRVLRSLLWWWKDNLKWATNVVTVLGKAFAITLIFWGIFFLMFVNLISGLWLMIIGWFLFNAASGSRAQVVVAETLRGENVAKYMTKQPISVTPYITVQTLVDDYMYQSHHHLYPVVEDDALVGYISLREVKSLRADVWKSTQIKDVMVERAKFQTVAPETSALDALNLLHQNSGTLLVTQGDQLVGILSAQDILKLISLKFELEES